MPKMLMSEVFELEILVPAVFVPKITIAEVLMPKIVFLPKMSVSMMLI